MAVTLHVRVDMISDWHVGLGSGVQGGIDRLVRRDNDGLPYIPAKTLTGIWRDACERAALALDNGSPASWSAWVDFVFGDQPALGHGVQTAPRPAAFRAGAARMARDLRLLLAAKPEWMASLTFVKPGVKIDASTGQALDKHLRFEEMVRGGGTLDAECELDAPEPALALLAAGARLIERLGGKRRRGSGRCRVRLAGIDESRLFALLEQEAPPVPQPAPPAAAVAFSASTDEAWTVIDLAVTVERPVIAASRTVGNVVESLDLVPGASLLPHVSRWLRGLGCEPMDLIPSGHIRVTALTPEVNAAPGLPVPFALRRLKDAGGFGCENSVFNLMAEDAPSTQQTKDFKLGWIALRGEGILPSFVETVKTLQTHNTVDDESQRPTTDVGGVYTYEAIAAGTRLRAQLEVRSSLAKRLAAANESWWKGLDGQWRLGRSSKDDYGQVRVRALDPRSPHAAETDGRVTDRAFTLWLTSDLVVRNDNLRPAADANAFLQQLERRLGSPLQVERQFIRINRHDSWHASWGLPRPTLVALAAGSCFKLRGKVSNAALARLQRDGLGERCAEGFGRLLIDSPLLAAKLSTWTVSGHVPTTPVAEALPHLKMSEHPYATIVEQAAWRERIRSSAALIAASKAKRNALFGWGVEQVNGETRSTPPMSQLGGLRAAVGGMREAGDAVRVRDWLTRLRQTPGRKDRWPPGALDKVEALLSEPERVWTALSCDGGWPVLIQGGRERLKAECWLEALQTLFGECLHAHSREAERG